MKPNGTRDVTFLIGPGVYLLYMDDRLQWVGSTKCLAERIGRHCAGHSTIYEGQSISIDFNRVCAIPCEEEGRELLERNLIQRLKPEMNTRDIVEEGYGKSYTFKDGPLKGMTIRGRTKPPHKSSHETVYGGTNLDDYLDEIENLIK